DDNLMMGKYFYRVVFRRAAFYRPTFPRRIFISPSLWPFIGGQLEFLKWHIYWSDSAAYSGSPQSSQLLYSGCPRRAASEACPKMVLLQKIILLCA
ncbi:MAG: hypothetical protein ACRC4N_07570, partial [Gammaproteobacteria bacterium]